MASDKKVKKATADGSQSGSLTSLVVPCYVASKENFSDFLYQSQAAKIIKDAIAVLVEKRPSEPIEFLVDYFSANAGSTSLVQKAYEKLFRAHYSMPAFGQYALESYHILSSSKNNKSGLRGLLGEAYNELIMSLCSEVSQKHSAIAYEKVCASPKQVISFKRYYRSVLILLVLKDFINVAESLFEDIDSLHSGNNQRDLCKQLLFCIEKACEAKQSPRSNNIGDWKIFDSLELKCDKDSSLLADVEDRVMEVDEFTREAVRIFMSQV